MNTFSKRLAGFVGLGIVTSAAVAAVAYAAVTFGPSRPTFTWANPATYITFNSITDNPVWGDERFLVKARDVNAGTNTYSTKMSVADNQELLVAVYFHNNAAANLNLVAKNTKVRVDLPSGTASNQELKAFISADNATPQSVFSTMDLTNANPFTLQYVSGSAQLKTNFVTTTLSDTIVKDGALVGTNGPDGKVPGCGEFSGYATFRVKVKVEKEQPQSKFACEALDVNKVSRTRFDFTAHASVTNATVQSYVFTAKDASGNVVDTQTVTTSALSANYIFNQEKTGTYTVSVVVKTNKGDAPVGSCVKQVTVEAQPVTPPPPVVSGKVTEIPNTGAGAVAGIFAGASALAGIGHYAFRRFVA
ncbi:hypothetical protein HYS85_02025 [Candidatus Saccharibacteria bacterium]|nr:hypothetical protein [Candidatus Saccharibacteria bacterium]